MRYRRGGTGGASVPDETCNPASQYIFAGVVMAALVLQQQEVRRATGVDDIERATLDNTDFRRVLFTGDTVLGEGSVFVADGDPKSASTRRTSRSLTRKLTESLSSCSTTSESANRPPKDIRWSVAMEPVTSSDTRTSRWYGRVQDV